MRPWLRSAGERLAGAVDFTIPSDPRWLQLARLVVDCCCTTLGLGSASSRDIVMAVDEAVSNVIRHGYGGAMTRPIRIVCRRRGKAFEVEVWDRGQEFDPFEQPVPPPGDLRRGGRGLFLIRSLVDEGEYMREDGWNRVRLRKRLPVTEGRH